ncbi:hypothetical protein ES676_02525 [Bizionia saleffrena]|uniref:Metalloprotease n=1 Tax=Bizionia saleffrena TaxID=291189 RepID=A0A8H2QFH0_9FLAO|nr:hypothetical protein [Bizionia saleffrena]TYB78106.1 hypothetical protein ES676_02525 [Bizionia saleffrena]
MKNNYTLVLLVLIILGCSPKYKITPNKTNLNFSNSNLIDGCLVSGSNLMDIHGLPKITDFPGNKNFESHFYKNVGKIMGLMDIQKNYDTRVYVYEDGLSPNAIAFNGRIDNYSSYLILFGENMILNHVIPTGDYGEDLNTIIMQSILAHEFAHIGQYIKNVNGSTRDLELMADVMSGWYVGYLTSNEGQIQVESGIENVPNIRLAMIDSYNSGDYAYNAPDHHGTPQMRLDAFLFGVELSLQKGIFSYWDAFNLAKLKYNL